MHIKCANQKNGGNFPHRLYQYLGLCTASQICTVQCALVTSIYTTKFQPFQTLESGQRAMEDSLDKARHHSLSQGLPYLGLCVMLAEVEAA